MVDSTLAAKSLSNCPFCAIATRTTKQSYIIIIQTIHPTNTNHLEYIRIYEYGRIVYSYSRIGRIFVSLSYIRDDDDDDDAGIYESYIIPYIEYESYHISYIESYIVYRIKYIDLSKIFNNNDITKTKIH